ncbi:response regulator [Vibrio parahaemolyticus]
MKILIIEDTHEKLKSITTFFDELNHVYDVAENRDSAQKKVEDLSYDFIILDMTLPEDDSINSELIPLAGLDILEIMSFEGILTPTVILTGYDKFGRHKNSLTIQDLKNEVSKNYSDIVSSVIYYDGYSDDWKIELRNCLSKLV